MKDYQKCHFKRKRIQICRDKHSIYLLDYLLYEKPLTNKCSGKTQPMTIAKPIILHNFWQYGSPAIY